MMAKKFVRGTFELDQNVSDINAYEEKIMPGLNWLIKWGNDNGVYLLFGTSEDKTYLCEFEVKAQTAQMCKGYVSELKALLKRVFPKAKILFQASGNVLW